MARLSPGTRCLRAPTIAAMAPSAPPTADRGGLRRRVLRFARSHPHATAAQIAVLAECHPSTAAKHLGGLRRRVLRYARSHPHATAAQIAVLARCPPSRTAEHLGACPQYPVRLCTDQMRQGSAKTSRTSTELALLSRSSDPETRATVARNPHCPPPVLQRLARDPNSPVRFRVAHAAQRSSLATLVRLAADVDADVRGAVARNANCPQRVLARLAGDPTQRVRALVPLHDATSWRVLEWLSTSSDPTVALLATRKLEFRRSSET